MEPWWHSRRPMLILMAAVGLAGTAGVLVGASVAMGVCAVIYLINR